MLKLHHQFGHPRGPLGSLVGHLMAVKNTPRSRWVLEVLALQPGERVLEIGFGPGADIARALRSVGSSGQVTGIDVSSTMLRQASRRNLAALRSGRASLHEGSVDRMPFPDDTFDAAFAINCAQFWPDLVAGFREIHRVVRPGGRTVIAVQPRNQGATVADSQRWLGMLTDASRSAGWPIQSVALGPTCPPVATLVLEKTER